MGTHGVLAVLMAVVMVLAPIAGAAGTVGATASSADEQAIDDGEVALQTSNPSSLPGEFVNATESVDVWDRAIFPLRADRSDDATTATSVDNIITEAAAPNDGTSPLQVPGSRNLVVYPNDTTIDLTFNIASKTDANQSDLDGEEIHLIAAKAESSDDPELPSAISIQTLRNFVQNESDNENVIFENASKREVDDTGVVEFDFDLTKNDRGAGTYTFMAVTTANGGIDVSEQNISVPGNATVLGVDSAVVQQSSSQISVDDTHEVGDTISFDVDANVTTSENRVEHTVALWNESAVASERLRIIAPDDLNENTSASEFTINHTIKNVSGVQNVEDNVSAFGRTLNQNNRSGVFEAPDIVSFIANEGNFSEPETNRVGTTTINASMTAINASSPNETIDVETLESFETGDYVAVHMAMADGNLTKVSSERKTITMVEPGQLGLFNVTIVSTNDPVTPGDTLTVTARIENTGNSSDSQQIHLKNTTDDIVDSVKSPPLTLNASESTTETFELQITESTKSGSFSVQSNDDTDETNIKIGPTYELSNLETNGVGNASESFTANVTVNNTGGQSGAKNVTLSFAGETVYDQEEKLDPGNNTTISTDIPTTASDYGANTLSAATNDDTQVTSVTLNRLPTFEVDVIKAESDLDVVTSQNISVVAEIRNVGDTQDSKTVTLTNVTNATSNQVDNESITLGPGERQDVTTELTATTAGTLDFNVSTEDDSEVVTATVEEANTFLDVTIDELSPTPVDEPKPGTSSEKVTVDVSIKNLGNTETTQEISFTKNGEEFASPQVSSVGTATLNETLNVTTGDAPEVAVAVASENDTAEDTINVSSLPEFDVSIEEASNRSQPINNSKPVFEPTVNVTNVGDQDGSGNLTVRFNGSLEDDVSLGNIGSGSTETIIGPGAGDSVPINTSGLSNGPKLLEAEATNDTITGAVDLASQRVTVGGAANFSVKTLSVNQSIADPGDELSLTATINNTGSINGTKPVQIEFADRQLQITDLNLSATDNETITRTFTAQQSDIGSNRELAVGTPDGENTSTVTVREPAEFEADLSVGGAVIANETATATVDVSNVGGDADNQQEIRLFVDGIEESNQSVTVGEGNTSAITLGFTPTQQGDVDVLAVTNDDTDTSTVTVGQPGTLDITVRSITNPVTENGTVDAVATVDNVGDGSVSNEQVSFLFDGQKEDSDTVSLAGGETTRLTLSHSVDRNLSEGTNISADYSIISSDDTESGSVIIEEPPEAASFSVSNLNAESNVLNVSQTVDVSAKVTNVGNQSDTQDINFTIGGVTDSNSSTLSKDNNATVDFSFDPVNVGSTGNVTYDVASDNQTVSDTIRIEEPTPGTPEITSVDFPEDQATQEEAFEVDVTIENVGDLDLDGNETVNVTYAGVTQATTNASINASGTVAPGGTETVTVSVTPAPEQRTGVVERDIEVTTGGFGSVAEDNVTETVPVDFEGIQSGVNAVSGTDKTVLVEPGTYEPRRTITVNTDGVTIEPSVSGTTPTVKQPRLDATALAVTASDVTVDSIEFTSDGSGTAIALDSGTDNADLTDARIENWATGIEETAGSNLITGVRVFDTDTGIILDGSGQTDVEYASVSRAGTGIDVESDDNTILGATVSRSPVGIDMFGNETTVQDSTVRGADEYGVRVTDVPGSLSGTPSATPSATITDSSLESNSLSVLSDGSEVDARGNWWGSPSPDEYVDYAARSNVSINASTSRIDSNFTVSATSPGDVVRDSAFTVDVTVNNTGTKRDRQTIALVDASTTIDSKDVELASDEERTVSLSYTPDLTDAGSLDLSARSIDDQTGLGPSLILEPAAFNIQSVAPQQTNVALGNNANVNVTIENTGGAKDTATVALDDGTATATKNPTVASGANTTVRFSRGTTGFRTGPQSLTTTVTDSGGTVQDTQTASVTIDPAELSSIGLSVGDTDLDVGDTTTASVTETLTDSSTSGVTSGATLSSSDTDIISVSGAQLTAEGTGTTTITAQYTDGGITRSSSAVSVTVSEAGDDDGAPPSGGSSGGGGSVSLNPPASPDGLDVTRSETQVPSLDVTTDQQVAKFSTVENVRSITFETSDEIGEVEVSDVNPDTGTVATPGTGVTVQEITVPESARNTPSTIEFSVSRERLDAVDAEAEDLRVFRGTDTGYEPLDTVVEDDGGDTIIVTAETPGFSVFTVSAVSQPEAVADVTPGTVQAGDEVELSASGSTTEYGEIVAYDWTVAGESLSGETASTTLDEAGTVDVELTVTDDAGGTASTTASVTVEAADEPADDGTADDETVDGGAADGEPADDRTTEDEPAADDGIPGFGAVIALVALLAAALLAARRRDI